MIRAALIIALMATAPAYAVNLDQVSSCLNMAPEDTGTGAMAEMLVELSTAGEVQKVDVLRYSPDTDQGRRIAHMSAEAVVSCGPYPGEGPTSHIFFWPDGVPPTAPAPIITMPDNADGTDNSLAEKMQRIIDGK